MVHCALRYQNCICMAKLGKPRQTAKQPIDVILLVRGGGSMEDLWAFNDEQLARTIVQSPVPLVSGVGHETDFTIADFCADLRAPTPTAAAELVAQPREVWLGALDLLADRLESGVQRQIEQRHQRLDQAAAAAGRPSGLVAREQLRWPAWRSACATAVLLKLQRLAHNHKALEADFAQKNGAGASPCVSGWNAPPAAGAARPAPGAAARLCPADRQPGPRGDQRGPGPPGRRLARHAGRRGAGRDRSAAPPAVTRCGGDSVQ
jgi:exonuclease VII large subunit